MERISLLHTVAKVPGFFQERMAGVTGNHRLLSLVKTWQIHGGDGD